MRRKLFAEICEFHSVMLLHAQIIEKVVVMPFFTRYDQFEGDSMTVIVLLAGKSTRMGENKLLLPWKGKQILSYSVEVALSVSESVLCVTGFEKERIEEALSIYPTLRTVYNKDYEKGQKTSILKGLECTEGDVAIITGDIPLLERRDFVPGLEMIRHYDAARAYCKDIPGHPVFINGRLRESLLSTEKSIFAFLEEKKLYRYQGSIGTVFDIDTRERYRKLLDGDISIPD